LRWSFASSILIPAQEEPTFRTQANVVLVPAATSRHRLWLKTDDFIIKDDGIRQTVRLDEAAEAEPVALVVAIQIGRRADF
jgi:hypothetical protein